MATKPLLAQKKDSYLLHYFDFLNPEKCDTLGEFNIFFQFDFFCFLYVPILFLNTCTSTCIVVHTLLTTMRDKAIDDPPTPKISWLSIPSTTGSCFPQIIDDIHYPIFVGKIGSFEGKLGEVLPTNINVCKTFSYFLCTICTSIFRFSYENCMLQNKYFLGGSSSPKVVSVESLLHLFTELFTIQY